MINYRYALIACMCGVALVAGAPAGAQDDKTPVSGRRTR